MTVTAVSVVVRGHTMPGRALVTAEAHENIHVGVQRKEDVVEHKPGDASEVEWRFDVDVVADGAGGPYDFKGPYVHGKKGDRFLYLCWGDVDAKGHFHRFRRAKLMLAAVDASIVRDAIARGALLATLAMTLPDGTPVCAAQRPPRIVWSAPRAR
jgi:hypothetical protein